jgi:cytochrome c-type biogenesis protein CcmH/NrfG
MSASTSSETPGSRWTVKQALIWAGIPLALAAALGVFIRRPEVATPARAAAGDLPRPTNSLARAAHVTPDQLRHMADKEAEPLLAQLQSKPADPELLSKLGYIYFVTKNFKEASAYFRRSVDLKDDAIVRNELGRAYYYAGDPDDALAEFEQVLKSDPNNVNALFNVGMVKWQSKSDVEGALAAWRQILKKNPHHPRRAEVEQLIARAQQERVAKEPMKAAHP